MIPPVVNSTIWFAMENSGDSICNPDSAIRLLHLLQIAQQQADLDDLFNRHFSLLRVLRLSWHSSFILAEKYN